MQEADITRSDVDSQDVYSLKTLYIDGRKAPTTHVHWRRFDVASLPWQDLDAFDEWLTARWVEKEKLLTDFAEHGSFPSADGYITIDIRLRNAAELFRLVPTYLAPVAGWLILRLAYGVLSFFWRV
jgi:hypothetical protein